LRIGGESTPSTRSIAWAMRPRWSSDGRRTAYIRAEREAQLEARQPFFSDGTDGAAMPATTHGHGHGDMDDDD